jgi:hypothetical protein
MFILNETHEYDWPVEVEVPQDGGSFARQRFTARFRVLGRAAVQAALDEGGDDALVRAVTTGWNADEVRVEEAGGHRPLPFTAENLSRIVANPFVRAAMVNAYLGSISGRRAKN